MAELAPALEGLAQRLGPRLAAMVTALETQGGVVLATEANLAIAMELIAAMRDTMFDQEFIDAVLQFLDTFEGHADDALELFTQFDTAAVRPELAAGIVSVYKELALAAILSPVTYQRLFLSTLADTLVMGITTSAEVEALALQSAGTAQGLIDTPVVPGIEQQVERAVVKATADAVGAQFFRYLGTTIKTSRKWCKDRVGHVWHKEEVNEWGRKAAEDPVANGWAGMVEGTNEDTIWLYLGGWFGEDKHCRHMLVPVPWSDVPEEDRQRMRDKGLIS